MSGERPNVLWIFVDQLRWHALSGHGDTNVKTPHLDALAQAGVSLARPISPCPVCTPARGCVVTGQYASTTGIRYLGDLLPPSQRTVAHAFRAAGYRTSYVGKWHLASAQNPIGHNEGAEFWVHPLLRGGFEDWYGFELSNHFWRTRYSSGELMWPPLELEGYQTDGLTTLSLDYLRKRAEQAPETPWFHVLSLETPHHGSDAAGVASVLVDGLEHTRHPAPPEYEARFHPEDLELRGNVPPRYEKAARSMLAQYYAMIANLDDNVGRILAWLEESGQAENTLVAFFSDHGDMGGSHGRFQKCVPYEESVRVPLILRQPGQIPPGTGFEAAVSLVDLAPTCLGLCGLPVPPEMQGRNLSMPLGAGGGPVEDVGVLSQWFGNPRYTPEGELAEQWRALYTARYTYARWESGRGQMFDLQADPLELVNLYDDPACAELRGKLHERLLALVQAAGEDLGELPWLA